MDSKTIVMCVVALLLGMLMANMLKDVCGCKNVVEGQVYLPRSEGGQYCGQDGDFSSLSTWELRTCVDNHDKVFAICNDAKFPDQCNDGLLDGTDYHMCGCKWDASEAPPGMCRAIDPSVGGGLCSYHLNNRIGCLMNDVCQWCDTDENGNPKKDTCISGRGN